MQTRIFTFLMLMLWGATTTQASNHIVGEAKVLPEDMCEFVRQHNPDFPLEIAEAYYETAPFTGFVAMWLYVRL